ncbi:MAG: hypothetical protein PHP64_08210 [Actinomycetota bacterium]|nr:hypothetical protein [Actinomycetota bacterium]
MGNRKNSKSTHKILQEVFDKYPGSKIAEYLKEGAKIQATIDGETFAIEKADGHLKIKKGILDSPDISATLNRAACDYIASSRELEDFVTRTRQCIEGSRKNCSISYETAGTMRLLLKGYLDFAKKLGMI